MTDYNTDKQRDLFSNPETGPQTRAELNDALDVLLTKVVSMALILGMMRTKSVTPNLISQTGKSISHGRRRSCELIDTHQ